MLYKTVTSRLLQQYRIRKIILMSNYCISDNTHRNPPANFPEVTNVIFMCIKYLWIHRLID